MHHFKLIAVAASLAILAAGILPAPSHAGSEEQSSIEQTFQKAKKDYLEKNLNSASEQIQKGANYMKDEAAKATDKGKEALTASAGELDQLALDMKKGTVASVKRMDDSFARAYHALATNSHIRSMEAWTKKQTVKAGDALDSATGYLERGFNWAGQKVEKGTRDAVRKSKDLSVKLQNKGTVIAEDVGNGLKDTGKEIEKFGKRISSE